MKHVFVIGIRPSENGGIENLFLNIAKGIDPHFVKYSFIVAENDYDKSFESNIQDAGHDVIYIKQGNNSATFLLNCIKTYIRMKPDIAHINVTCGSRAFDGLLFKIVNPHGSIIFHSHSNIGKRPLKYTILIPIFLVLGKYLLGCSLEAARFFFGDSINRNRKYILLHNGIDTRRFRFNASDRLMIRTEYCIDEKEPIFGFVGRLSAEKNITYAIDMYETYYKLAHKGYLFIIGEGDMHDLLIKYAKEKGLSDRVLFLGKKKDVEKYMCAMDALLLPSLNEGLGLVLIEAQSTSLTCFASQFVPKEAFISQYAHCVDITESPTNSYSLLEKFLNQERTDQNDFVKELGYDIGDTIEKIKELYLSV